MDADERLRFDFDQTTQLLRALVDLRFKLLAFVPTVAGTAVAFFGKPRPAAELLAVGLVGLLATLGIFVCELRNSQAARSSDWPWRWRSSRRSSGWDAVRCARSVQVLRHAYIPGRKSRAAAESS